VKPVKLRVGEKVAERLKRIMFKRYPNGEWGSLFKFGYRADGNHGLLLTIVDVLEPGAGDLNEDVENVQFLETYLLKAALSLDGNGLGIGVLHSHPEDYGVRPSRIDDQMDEYLRGYFGDFAPGRPYASLIWSMTRDGKLSASGRAWWEGKWHPIETTVVGTVLQRHPIPGRERPVPAMVLKRLERMTGVLGEEAAVRLWNSTAVVLGVGGTGSAAAHSLARSCVGKIVVVDSDLIATSNSERVHGCEHVHLEREPKAPKVEILRDLIQRINPEIEVIAIMGNGLQHGAYEELVHADVVLGTTDTNHGRAALGELAYRYLCSSLQVNVVLEPGDDGLAGQVIQFTRYRPGKPCAYCRDQVDSARMAQELMSETERVERMTQAAKAVARGERGDPYWRSEAVISTVGSLTTIAGEFAANFAIGMLSGRFSPPSDFLELNLLAPDLGVTSLDLIPSVECACSERQGQSEQTPGGRIHVAPAHWTPPRRL
jgi:molybdopterin/thiamine biosynthesis adenylyltransferase